MPAQKSKARPLPMPVQLVVDHPTVITLPNGAFNAVLTLAVAYWRSECRPLPTGARDLMCIGRFDLRTYTKYKIGIHQCITLVCAKLAERYKEEADCQAARVRAARIARQARTAQQAAIHPAPSPPDEPTSLPTHAPRHTSGKVDLAARGASKARHEAYRKDGGKAALSDVDARAGVGGDGRLGQSPTGLIGNTPDTAYSDWNWEPTPTPPPLVEQE